MNRITFILLLTLFGVFGVAAQTPPPAAAAGAASANLSRAPSMVLENIRTALQQRFNRMDANQDGVVTKEEFPKASPRSGDQHRERRGEARESARSERARSNPPQDRLPMMPQRFEQLDNNQDGKIEEEELLAIYERMKEMDTDGDGEVTPREFLQARNQRPQGQEL